MLLVMLRSADRDVCWSAYHWCTLAGHQMLDFVCSSRGGSEWTTTQTGHRELKIVLGDYYWGVSQLREFFLFGRHVKVRLQPWAGDKGVGRTFMTVSPGLVSEVRLDGSASDKFARRLMLLAMAALLSRENHVLVWVPTSACDF